MKTEGIPERESGSVQVLPDGEHLTEARSGSSAFNSGGDASFDRWWKKRAAEKKTV